VVEERPVLVQSELVREALARRDEILGQRRDPVLAAERRREWKQISKAIRAQSRVTKKP
jgi:hypothetical protein